MKRLICIAIASAIFFVSCKKDESDENTVEGAYAGTFHRSGMDTANVIIYFEGTRFYGQSDHAKYPAICGGSYQFGDRNVNFTDTCSWTADFDWTLILDGNYNVSRTDDELNISRTDGATTDEYKLRRVIR